MCRNRAASRDKYPLPGTANRLIRSGDAGLKHPRWLMGRYRSTLRGSGPGDGEVDHQLRKGRSLGNGTQHKMKREAPPVDSKQDGAGRIWDGRLARTRGAEEQLQDTTLQSDTSLQSTESAAVHIRLRQRLACNWVRLG